MSSLDTMYQYAVKIDKKFKQKKWDIGSANPKQGNGAPKKQNKGPSQGGATQDSLLKLQVKKNTTKMKEDMGKWCEFHKGSTHNTSECWAKKSLVVEMKPSESDAGSDSESKPDKGTEKREAYH